MSKEKSKQKEIIRELQASQERIERKIKSIQNACSHMNKHGEYKLQKISDTQFRCKECGTIFSMLSVTRAEATAMLDTLNDITNQLKLRVDPSDTKMLYMISSTVNSVKELAKLYEEEILNNKHKGNGNNKKKHSKNVGGYGVDSLFD